MGTTSSTAARHHETPSTRSTTCRGTYARNAISHEHPRKSYVLHIITLQFGRKTFHGNVEFYVCGAVFVTYHRHICSPKGSREKDTGYVRIRANKDLW